MKLVGKRSSRQARSQPVEVTNPQNKIGMVMIFVLDNKALQCVQASLQSQRRRVVGGSRLVDPLRAPKQPLLMNHGVEGPL